MTGESHAYSLPPEGWEPQFRYIGLLARTVDQQMGPGRAPGQRLRLKRRRAVTHTIWPMQPDRTELFVVPIKLGDPQRPPAFGTKGSKTGGLVDPATFIVIWTESSIEKKAVKAFLADRQVRSVKEQALKIPYLADNGTTLHHFVDLLVTLWDGTRIGFVIKPESTAVRDNLRGFVQRLAKVTPVQRASRLQLLTDRQLPEWGNLNADLLIKVRFDRRTHVDDDLRDLAPTLTSPIRIGELADYLGGGHIAFRPIVRALYYGTLDYLGVGRIDKYKSVRFSGQVMVDTGRFGAPRDLSMTVPPEIRRRHAVPLAHRRASYQKQ